MAAVALLEFSNEIEIQGYQINYIKVGSGQTPIFCFPGLLDSLRFSSPDLIRKIGSELGDKYTFYTWDTPGYFLSRPPLRKDTHISFDSDVELCADFLMRLCHSKCILMGWSAGGQTAIQFAIKYPQVVEKLIVWGTWDLFENDHLPVHHRHRNLSTVDPVWLSIRIQQHGVSYAEYEKYWHAWVDMIEREHFNQDKDTWVQKFKKITCPTLIIAGSNDPLGPLVQAQHLHQHIKSSRLEIIKGAPHWMQLTHLVEMFKLLSAFLD